MNRRHARLRSILAGALILGLLVAPAIAGWPLWRIAAALALCPIAAWIAVEDLTTMTISDGAVAAVAAIGLAVAFASGADIRAVALQVAVALATGLALFIFSEIYGRLRGIDVLGFGDVKLVVASAILVGPWGVALQILLASVAALLFAVIRAVRRRRPLRAASRLPFGTFLAPALVMVWTWFPVQP